MALAPGYGETPLPDDELVWLVPAALEALGEPVRKADIYDLEEAEYEVVAERLIQQVLDGDLDVEDLLRDGFLRDLHTNLYSGIWRWAGQYRRHEVTIGIAPEQIATTLRSSLESMAYRWQNTDDWNARELGVAAHAESVRIHPFWDGNGRTTRLFADLVFLAAQDGETIEVYDWAVDKGEYIGLLRRYDQDRDPRALARFVPVQLFE